jgi:hypothetical protein
MQHKLHPIWLKTSVSLCSFCPSIEKIRAIAIDIFMQDLTSAAVSFIMHYSSFNPHRRTFIVGVAKLLFKLLYYKKIKIIIECSAKKETIS